MNDPRSAIRDFDRKYTCRVSYHPPQKRTGNRLHGAWPAVLLQKAFGLALDGEVLRLGEDISYVLETGRLPREKTSMA